MATAAQAENPNPVCWMVVQAGLGLVKGTKTAFAKGSRTCYLAMLLGSDHGVQVQVGDRLDRTPPRGRALGRLSTCPEARERQDRRPLSRIPCRCPLPRFRPGQNPRREPCTSPPKHNRGPSCGVPAANIPSAYDLNTTEGRLPFAKCRISARRRVHTRTLRNGTPPY